MPIPLIPIALATMIGGLGVSMGANLYKQHNQRSLWARQAQAYENLDKGYRQHLAKHGKTVNPDRAWTSYYGSAQTLRNNMENSIASSVGTVGGTFGAGAAFGRGLYKEYGKSSRWL